MNEMTWMFQTSIFGLVQIAWQIVSESVRLWVLLLALMTEWVEMLGVRTSFVIVPQILNSSGPVAASECRYDQQRAEKHNSRDNNNLFMVSHVKFPFFDGGVGFRFFSHANVFSLVSQRCLFVGESSTAQESVIFNIRLQRIYSFFGTLAGLRN